MRVSQCHRVPCAASSQDDTLSWGPDSHMSRICPKQMCLKFRENPRENDLNISKRCHLKGWSDIPSQPTAILLGRFPLLTLFHPWVDRTKNQSSNLWSIVPQFYIHILGVSVCPFTGKVQGNPLTITSLSLEVSCLAEEALNGQNWRSRNTVRCKSVFEQVMTIWTQPKYPRNKLMFFFDW